MAIHSTNMTMYGNYNGSERYHDDPNIFMNEFTYLFIVLRACSKSVFLCGDYNIDLLKINTNANFNLFYENVISSSSIPNIIFPTRMCDTTSTLIDNFILILKILKIAQVAF